jgi:subtilisin-like proprotein convertase family protein
MNPLKNTSFLLLIVITGVILTGSTGRAMTETAETSQIKIYLPSIYHYPPSAAELLLYCSNFEKPISIPDFPAQGLKNNFTLQDSRRILDMNIRVEVTHSWVGDLVIDLQHQYSRKTARLIDRPGYPASTYGCSGDGLAAIFDDEISIAAENRCYSGPNAVAGIYLPLDPLSTFDDEILFGDWTITVSDMDDGDTGKLKSWCMEVLIGPPSEEPPVEPPPALPSEAQIKNINGKDQALPLDCESRSAVDWANYFGTTINEIEFFNRLPKSDDPDSGFVGNVYGNWGQIPPNDYGVHARPVANLLNEYGVKAFERRPLSWDQLRAEIAAKRPVIVWVIGSASMNEKPIYYTASNQHRSIVAHYEHTVIVVGYSPNSVTILDGDTRINRALSQFLSSWSALNNMAITATP